METPEPAGSYPSLEEVTSGCSPAVRFSVGISRLCTLPVTISSLLSARKLHLSHHPGQGQMWPVGVTHKYIFRTT